MQEYKPFMSKAELDHIEKFGPERRTLKTPTILIVEDQLFSSRLLYSLLVNRFTCYIATSGEEAVRLYSEHVPCITFLDIELPDTNGHVLARFFYQCDPFGYLVMVTANHYEKDVLEAQQNQVQGFIKKPFSRQKIMEAIDKYAYPDYRITPTIYNQPADNVKRSI